MSDPIEATTGNSSFKMRPRLLAICTLLFGLAVSPVRLDAAEILVPEHHATIQGAIDAANDGDVVRVGPDVYIESINFRGKAIRVESIAGPEETYLTSLRNGSVVLFVSSETTASVLQGFTISDGTGTHSESGDAFGGGIFCQGASPTIAGNIIQHNMATFGAGIACVSFAAPTIRDNEIRYNDCTYGDGGGIYCGDSSSPLIENNRIHWGYADAGGGISCVGGSSPLIRGNRIVDNDADFGGGIAAQEQSIPAILDNEIRGNDANDDGGGIYIIDADTAFIENNDILDNTSVGDGGGVFIRQASAFIHGNLVQGNETTSFHGGGIYIINTLPGTHADLAGNRIEDNECRERGGGIYYGGISLSSRDDRFANNRASTGAGIHVVGADAAFHNAMIHGNQARHQGGGFDQNGGRVVLSSCTVADNSVLFANRSGGGLYLKGMTTTIVNGIVWGNKAPNDPQILHQSGTLTIDHCIVEGGWSGTAVLDVDPKFVNTTIGDFHLRLGSPAVDRGRNDSEHLPEFDFEGDARNLNGNQAPPAIVDLGADELRLEAAACFGTVGAANGAIENVLSVNGEAGDRARMVRVAIDAPITIDMNAPAAGPEVAPFVLYVWNDAPSVSTITLQPARLGVMAHPTPLAGGAAGQPLRIWNNLGFRPTFGFEDFPSTPAPSRVIDRSQGHSLPATLTFQGFIRDSRSAAAAPLSITNAVVLDIGD